MVRLRFSPFRAAVVAVAAVAMSVSLLGSCGDKGSPSSTVDGASSSGPATTAETSPANDSTTPLPVSTAPRVTSTTTGDVRPTVRFVPVSKGDPEIDYTLGGEYLQVEVFDTTIADAVNASIADDIEAAVLQFEAAVLDIGNIPDTGTGSELEVSARATLLTGPLLSVRTQLYQYLEGAAHGGTTVTTAVFDLYTGRRLALADVFAPGVDYLEHLSVTSRSELRSQLDDPSLAASIEEGTRPIPDSFAAWTFTDEALVIVFQEYQVGPYAIGSHEVTIPYSDLDGLLEPTLPLPVP